MCGKCDAEELEFELVVNAWGMRLKLASRKITTCTTQAVLDARFISSSTPVYMSTEELLQWTSISPDRIRAALLTPMYDSQ